MRSEVAQLLSSGMGIGPCAAGRGTLTSRPVNGPRHCCLAPQKRAWLTCPLRGCALRHTPQECIWGRAPAETTSPPAQRAALQSWQNVNESDKTRAPADLFQSALNALDLYHPAATGKSEIIDDPEDITVEQGQTAASVGRSIYEVSLIMWESHLPRSPIQSSVRWPHAGAKQARFSGQEPGTRMCLHCPADTEAEHLWKDQTDVRQAARPAAGEWPPATRPQAYRPLTGRHQNLAQHKHQRACPGHQPWRSQVGHTALSDSCRCSYAPQGDCLAGGLPAKGEVRTAGG